MLKWLFGRRPAQKEIENRNGVMLQPPPCRYIALVSAPAGAKTASRIQVEARHDNGQTDIFVLRTEKPGPVHARAAAAYASTLARIAGLQLVDRRPSQDRGV